MWAEALSVHHSIMWLGSCMQCFTMGGFRRPILHRSMSQNKHTWHRPEANIYPGVKASCPVVWSRATQPRSYQTRVNLQNISKKINGVVSYAALLRQSLTDVRSKQNPNQKIIASSQAIWHNLTAEALKWDYDTKHAFHGQTNHSFSTPLCLISALSVLKEINTK